MARTVKDARLDSRAARERLPSRKKPYYRTIEGGRHLGYYRGQRGGSWLARVLVDGRYSERKLGAADDVRDANGIDVLSFADAQAAARRWFDEVARGGVDPDRHKGPFTVADACDHYLVEYRREGKSVPQTTARLERIKAELGAIDIQKLTSSRIASWKDGIKEAGPLTRSKALDEATGRRREKPVDRSDEQVVRRRKASANRLLTVLKAALNHAFRHPPAGVAIPSRAAWEAVAPFSEADAPKIRYLTDPEAQRIVNAAGPDFRDMILAALLTGARYGELCKLKVHDFDGTAASLTIQVSKSGGRRSIALTDEGVALFNRRATGKKAGELLLTRDDGSAWQASQQNRRMKAACEAARIEPAVSFHILRHTYGSRLAMRGAPMAVIAAQLGHASTRMTERHYAHLGPSYVASVVRSLMGTVASQPVETNVIAIEAERRHA